MIDQAFLTGFFLLALAAQPTPASRVVMIQQIPSSQRMQAAPPPSTLLPPESAAQESAGFSTDQEGRIAIPRLTVEACLRTRLGGPPPEGVDCQQILELVDAERRRTAEGNLLRLLGQNEEVTSPSSRQPVNTVDADAIVREASSGSAQGDAAAIAARVRGGTPPPGPR